MIQIPEAEIAKQGGPSIMEDYGEIITFTTSFSFSPYRQLQSQITTCAIYRVKKMLHRASLEFLKNGT
jgi:hypothetical protein